MVVSWTHNQEEVRVQIDVDDAKKKKKNYCEKKKIEGRRFCLCFCLEHTYTPEKKKKIYSLTRRNEGV